MQVSNLTFPQHLQDVLIPNSGNVYNNLQQIHDGGEEQMAYKVGGDDAYVSNGKLEEVMHCLGSLTKIHSCGHSSM
jgi:hypothetical protein